MTGWRYRIDTRSILGASFFVLAACGGSPSDAPPPNILIIYADDLGYGDLGSYGGDIPTPRLDEMARDGMRFTDAHSSSGICTPSRYALLTGQYHWRSFHGIVRPWGESVFRGEVTLPESLHRAGYTTALIGKWHLGWKWGNKAERDWSTPMGDGPLEHGFGYYFGDDVPNYPPYVWIEGDAPVETPSASFGPPGPEPTEGLAGLKSGPQQPGWKLDEVMPTLTERVVEWVSSAPEPWFLEWTWTGPHVPIVPTVDYQGSTDVGGYGDYIHQLDAEAGEVLDAVPDNTLVIFASDNGPDMTAFLRARNLGHFSAGELRGNKKDIYEGGHRTPMIVRWPGHVEPGTVSDALVSQVDFFETLGEITGSFVPRRDGVSFLPVLLGDSGQSTELVHNTGAGHYALRSGDWVLIDSDTGYETPRPDWWAMWAGYVEDAEPVELYDLSSDLGQRVNVAASEPERVTTMQGRLSEWLGRSAE